MENQKEISNLEIERKFLVKSNVFKAESFKQTRIVQGFLSTNKKRIVRVRLKGEKGFLTIKGESSKNGLSRFEWEKEISKEEAADLLKLCKKGIIDKTRYEVKVDTHTFEVDEFYGDNEGLIIAEVELQSEEECYIKPTWLGKEVTGNKKYYNSQLSENPYKNW
ncbi:CYTH domain-containing protein [Oceanihabitans sediminis]|uniref:CYTH domain-containing protein n=1 Tax=Oceanihabitans sediminis TaxID=1812012 RepID=A0A368P7C6_9FLAO|nr:CYTH domain-containing protein [Oceanihabitans sediminis]MDX1773086.1 CYTH domain-containing protein [Oceanihabitans sediminis]RBP34780.1 CYTH domain-containing protein [Oceanihabitans sediminis]RCU58428.1 CYTH domain-containing protein [Oceanihabitans sediminis]